MKHPHHAAGTRSALAACVATALCLGAPAAAMAVPTTWTVNTCSEANTGSGTTGSLRYAAANAISGDTIDLTNTGCSTISLTTGGGVPAWAKAGAANKARAKIGRTKRMRVMGLPITGLGGSVVASPVLIVARPRL